MFCFEILVWSPRWTEYQCKQRNETATEPRSELSSEDEMTERKIYIFPDDPDGKGTSLNLVPDAGHASHIRRPSVSRPEK